MSNRQATTPSRLGLLRAAGLFVIAAGATMGSTAAAETPPYQPDLPIMAAPKPPHPPAPGPVIIATPDDGPDVEGPTDLGVPTPQPDPDPHPVPQPKGPGNLTNGEPGPGPGPGDGAPGDLTNGEPGPGPTVPDPTVPETTVPAPEVLGDSLESASPESLAYTGSELGTAGAGLALLAAGGATMVVARRRKQASA